MAKRSNTQNIKAYNKPTPIKPDLVISDIPDKEVNETIAPGITIPSTVINSLDKGTSDKTSEDERDYSAPVHVPSRESLAIDLVPSDLIFRLEEDRNDESRFAAAFWVVVGATLGVLINWITSDPITITIPSIVVLLIFVLFGIFMFFVMKNFNSRANKKMEEIKEKLRNQS